jgi:hypothetical protein
MIDQGSERGRLVATAIVAILLAVFGYSLGYQNGHRAGLSRLDWQLNLLATQRHHATPELRPESGRVDSVQALPNEDEQQSIAEMAIRTAPHDE